MSASLFFSLRYVFTSLWEEFEDFRNKYNKMTFERLSKVSGGSPANLTENTYKSVGGCMTTPVISIEKSVRIFEASAMMAEHKVGSVVVTDADGFLAGLLTSKQLVHKYMANPDRTSLPCEVEEYMNPNPVNMPLNFR